MVMDPSPKGQPIHVVIRESKPIAIVATQLQRDEWPLATMLNLSPLITASAHRTFCHVDTRYPRSRATSCLLSCIERNGQHERRRATMRKIAAAACVVSISSASSVFAMDLVTKAPQQEETHQTHLVSNPFRARDNNLTFSATGAAYAAG